MSSASPIVVSIVGRPNVGKSTLFNRLAGSKKSLVHDLPGVTRDIVEAVVDWSHHGFPFKVRLQDTGGLMDHSSGGKFTREIEEKIERALENSNVVLWVVDGDTGITPEDRYFGRWLRKRCKAPVHLIVNKVDDRKHEDRVHDFYELGMDSMLTVSAEHNRGTDEIRTVVSALVQKPVDAEDGLPEELEPELELPETKATRPKDDVDCNLAIVGRPNVGKSTLANALIGERRMIVSEIAGTTIDSVDAVVTLGDARFRLVDTAGIRRKSKTEKNVEVLSVVKSIQSIEKADVVLLLLDGEHGVVDQDEKIAGIIEKAGKGVVLVVNKWDLMAKSGFTKAMAAEHVRSQMRFLYYAPIVFVSAMHAKGLEELAPLALDIVAQRKVKVPTQELSRWVRSEADIHNPMRVKFYMSHQASKHPPTFVCHVSDPKKIDFSLKRHLVKGIRAKWGFMGNPVRILFTKSRNNRAFTT